jgi:hypothetical protein
MMIINCPHCGTQHVQTSLLYQSAHTAGKEKWLVLQCQNNKCAKLVLYRAKAVSTNSEEFLGLYPSASYEFPSESGIPTEIREDYREAGACLDVGCYKASLVMSRRALQRCLKEQGCTQKNLADAIEHAVKSNILRKAFHPLAEEIREFGNLSAHPDDEQLQNATRENAKQILDFVALIVEEFYEIPAQAKALKKKRENPK